MAVHARFGGVVQTLFVGGEDDPNKLFESLITAPERATLAFPNSSNLALDLVK
jgi:hypothetical protein